MGQFQSDWHDLMKVSGLSRVRHCCWCGEKKKRRELYIGMFGRRLGYQFDQHILISNFRSSKSMVMYSLNLCGIFKQLCSHQCGNRTSAEVPQFRGLFMGKVKWGRVPVRGGNNWESIFNWSLPWFATSQLLLWDEKFKEEIIHSWLILIGWNSISLFLHHRGIRTPKINK